tara:strand:- start:156 stop:698 length:543 start_codon:yes stop_codon:yes gene_type:complete
MTPIVNKTRQIPTTELVTGVGTDFSSDITSGFVVADAAAMNLQYDGNYKVVGDVNFNIANNVMLMTPSTTNEGIQFEKENFEANQEYQVQFKVSAIGSGSTYKLRYQNADTSFTDIHTVTTGFNRVTFVTSATVSTGNVMYLVLTTAGSNKSLTIDASLVPVKFSKILDKEAVITPITKR